MRANHHKSACRHKSVCFIHSLVLGAVILLLPALPAGLSFAAEVQVIALGDSLTHGTMDATNNAQNTLNAYLQKTVESLSTVVPLGFSQPL